MLRKRLIGVITVLNGWAVQSFGYRRYLPLGRPETLAENLDRWGADEILILAIDRTRRAAGPDLDLVIKLGCLGLSTPLTYGGGIRSVADATAVVQAGAERVCVDAAFHDASEIVTDIAAALGSQAVLACIPVARALDGLNWFDYRCNVEKQLHEVALSLLSNGIVSEALIIDFRNEGYRDAFDIELIRRFPCLGVPLIAFGGISEAQQVADVLAEPQVVAVGVGNFLAYREHAVQQLKRALGRDLLRPAFFAAEI